MTRLIGVDLRALQIGHQYRGVGEVVKRTLNDIFQLALDDPTGPSFVFYKYDDPIEPEDFLEIPEGLPCRTITVGKRPAEDIPRSTQEKLTAKWRAMFGDPLPEARICDSFLQYDYSLGVPLHTKTVLIKHDLIPYIFWNDYFESAWVPFKNKAARTTLRTLLRNYEFKKVLKRSLARAKLIVCVSDSTKRDLKKYFHVRDKKLKTIHLGVSLKPLASKTKVDSSKLPTKPYLLFVGGIDGRRRAVGDLIAAFNNLKADGHDLQLALVGENFQSAKDIPSETVRHEVLASSYADDILCLGYIDDATKQKLFKEAVAFVFPTLYEGFGIPVLEAMLMDCPVIAYKNSSIPEVGGGHVAYANDWEGIMKNVTRLLDMSDSDKQAMVRQAREHAETFAWEDTSSKLYQEITKLL